MRAQFKALLLIGDGMGDRPIAELGHRTPLEAAHTPCMDRLAREGECGLMDPIAPGIRAGSDTAHLALLGYDPYQVYTGRGPFEALGIGMEVRGGRCGTPLQLQHRRRKTGGSSTAARGASRRVQPSLPAQ
jgi:2,3-diphosphopglycerate-independent phosphoglycerate mutase